MADPAAACTTAAAARKALAGTAPVGTSVIGATLVMKGELTLDEDLVVLGTFDGQSIDGARCLSIGTFGRVRGRIHADSAEIAGTMDGSLDSNDGIVLRRTARVSGQLTAERLMIEDGTNLQQAVLTGRITRT